MFMVSVVANVFVYGSHPNVPFDNGGLLLFGTKLGKRGKRVRNLPKLPEISVSDQAMNYTRLPL
jgi:hypothetical protein